MFVLYLWLPHTRVVHSLEVDSSRQGKSPSHSPSWNTHPRCPPPGDTPPPGPRGNGTRRHTSSSAPRARGPAGEGRPVTGPPLLPWGRAVLPRGQQHSPGKHNSNLPPLQVLVSSPDQAHGRRDDVQFIAKLVWKISQCIVHCKVMWRGGSNPLNTPPPIQPWMCRWRCPDFRSNNNVLIIRGLLIIEVSWF